MAVSAKDLIHAPIQEVSERIRKKEVSPVEITDLMLARVDELDSRINALAHVFRDEVRSDAKRAEEEIRRGQYRGPLHGIPIVVKDWYESGPTTFGSKALRDYVAPRDAASVRNLKEAGALLLGKTCTWEFGGGWPTNASYFKPTHNPWNTKYECGGSSSGTAGAIASGMAYAGMGSCTGGSIRWPACCTSLVGFKATYGRVSRAGVYPMSWSLDHAGPLTRTVMDAAYMLQGCAGYDPEDPASANAPLPDFTEKIGREIKGMKIGLLRSLYEDNCDPKVKTVFDAALPIFEKLGAELVDVPSLTLAQMQALEWPALFSDSAAIQFKNTRSPRWKDYNPDARQFIQYGLLVSAAYYHLAQRGRAQVRDSLLKTIHTKCEVLLLPTVGFTVPPVADATPGLSMLAGDFTVYTALFNLTGFPALTVPAGFDSDGLPVGLQIAGKPFDESTVLQVARAYEQEAGWHKKHADI